MYHSARGGGFSSLITSGDVRRIGTLELRLFRTKARNIEHQTYVQRAFHRETKASALSFTYGAFVAGKLVQKSGAANGLFSYLEAVERAVVLDDEVLELVDREVVAELTEKVGQVDGLHWN